jgi:hypothetical protein
LVSGNQFQLHLRSESEGTERELQA